MTEEAAVVTPDATPAPAAETPAVDSSWSSGYDDETRGWLNNRGMDKMSADEALTAAINGHRNAEKSLGVPVDRRIDIPSDGNLDPVYNRLGRPEDPDGYEFTGAEEVDKAFDDWAKTQFHKAGVSKENGDALYNEFKSFINGTLEQNAQDQKVAFEAADLELQKEWSSTYERNKNLALVTANKLGLDADQFENLKGALGPNEAMKLMQKIGAGMSEDVYVGPDGPGADGATTPEGAREEIKALKLDTGFQKKLQTRDVDALKKWDALHTIGYSS
jgi:hypothetical protein